MYPVKVIAWTLIWCGVFGVIVRFVDIERTVGHQFTFCFHYYQSVNKKKYWTCIIILCKLQHGMQKGTWYLQFIKVRQAIECAWLDWGNLIGAQIPTKYKIPTIYYANIRPNKHREILKSKATYSRATTTKTKGETIYRKLKFER